MENILNKALSEVLTPLYSEELRDAFDTGYRFSPQFENEMRELIRKTDRKASRYIGYLAVAACAAIAIGSAVIIPSILNSNIGTQEPGDTTTSAVPAISERDSSADVSSSTTTSETDIDDDAIEPLDHENDAVGDNSSAVTSVSDNTEPAESSAVVSDNTVPELQITTDDEDVSVDDDTDTDTEYIVVTGGDHDEKEGDDADIAEDDVDSEPDEGSVDTPASDDYAVIVDASDDDTAIVGTGDYDISETYTVEVNNGDKLGDVMKKIMPDFDFNNLWATSADYSPTGTMIRAGNQTEYLNFYCSEYQFIQDFVHSLGSAEANNEGYAETQGIQKIKLYIRDKQVKVTDYSDYGQNASAWKNYSRWFRNNEDWIDEEEDIMEPLDDTVTLMTVTISSTGKVEVQSSYVVSDKNTNKNYLYQLSNERFDMDTEAVNTLFDNLRKAHISEDAQTVGDIIDGMSLTADNIDQANISVHDIYDTDLYHVKIGYDFIVGLLEDHRNEKAAKVLSNQLSELEEPNGEISVEFYTKDSAHIKIYLDIRGYCYIADQFTGYKFSITETDINNALDAVEKANNYTIPRYSTLGEYLADKNFTKLRWVNFGGTKNGEAGSFDVHDEKELNDIIELLKKEFADAEYLKDQNTRYDCGKHLGINLQVEGYESVFQFYENDTVEIRVGSNRNLFRMSDGAIGRIEKLLSECTNAAFYPRQEEDEWEQVVDDVDVDEELVVEDVPVDEDEIIP